MDVTIYRDLKTRNQVQMSASKENKELALLRNTFVSREPLQWKRLYTTFVRPHLKYDVAA